MTVYALLHDGGESWDLIAIFSTRERAEQHGHALLTARYPRHVPNPNEFDGLSDYRIQEFDLDDTEG